VHVDDVGQGTQPVEQLQRVPPLQACFRVDRIGDPTLTGQRFRPRALPAEDALTFVQSGIRRMPQRYAVRVRVATPAEDVARAVGHWGTVTPSGDGCLLEMNVDSLEWPVMVLAQVGADFVVESPDELSAEVARVAASFARCVS